MHLKIVNYSYYNNNSDIEKYNAPILLFFCRDKEWKFHTVFMCDKKNLAPEMYVPAAERMIAEEQEEIIKIDKAPNSNYGEETIVCYTTFPWQVKKLRKLFTHSYLSDVKWEKMCIEKMGIRTPYINVPDDYTERWLEVDDISELSEDEHFYVPVRFVAWDIETNAEPVFPNFNGYKDAEKCEIISITAYDSYTETYNRFFWHPYGVNIINSNEWNRRGEYYVPALKGYKEYDKINTVINHSHDNEIDTLKSYFNWYSLIRPDAQYGFNTEGGYKISTKKGYSRKYWFNGFDMLYLYHRAKQLDLLDEIQKLSPIPNHLKGVRFRSHGNQQSVVIDGVCQIDWIYTNEIFMYHKKFNDFREGNLQGYMSYFLGFGKVPHKEQIWEMWKNNLSSNYDPTNPELVGTKKKENLVKKLYEKVRLRRIG